jgi:hypothetical protein
MAYETLTGVELDREIMRCSNNINKDTGFYWWKMYTYSAFWSVTSTPINLAITIFTALTTAQTTTGSLVGENISVVLGVITLILSVINTFFKPSTQLIENQTRKEKWADIAIEFEDIYHSVAHNDIEKRNKLTRLVKNWERVCSLKKTNDNNYLIDVIFLFSSTFCIRKDIKWLPEASEEYKRERERLRVRNMHLIDETIV